MHLNCDICVCIVNISCDCFISIRCASDTSFAFSIVYCSALSCYFLSLAFPPLLFSPLLSSPLLSSPLLSSPLLSFLDSLAFQLPFLLLPSRPLPLLFFSYFLSDNVFHLCCCDSCLLLSVLHSFIHFVLFPFFFPWFPPLFSSCQVGVIPEKHTWVFYTLEEVANGIQVRGVFVYSP